MTKQLRLSGGQGGHILMCGVLFIALSATSTSAGQVTSDDLIRLHQGGLGDEVLIATIESGEIDIDTSPDGLLRLREAGLSDDVILTVMTCPQ